MRIGFATALTNDFDARPLIQKLAESEVDVQIEFEQSPTLLNIPAGVKKLFSNGVEACIAFVQSSEEEQNSLALAQEKIIDVEVDYGKYCIVCTVLDEEIGGETEIEAVASERLKECLQLLLGVRPEKMTVFVFRTFCPAWRNAICFRGGRRKTVVLKIGFIDSY